MQVWAYEEVIMMQIKNSLIPQQWLCINSPVQRLILEECEAHSFYWAVSYTTFAFESVWDQWLKPNRHERSFCMTPITCSYPRTSKCYDFWKRKTLDSNIKWTSEDKWIVFLFFCVYRTKAAGPACPPASQPCHAISLYSHFKVWHQLLRTPSQPGISFQPSHFSPTTINFLFRLAQME